MIHGLDTGFLIAAALEEHPLHVAAKKTLRELIIRGDAIGVAPQILAEFIHVATEPRRFSEPLSTEKARLMAEQWWTASDTVQVFPNHSATKQFLSWLRIHSLGRKRLLDTLLAATYLKAEIFSILTTNPTDFTIFGSMTCITPGTVIPD